MCWDAETQTSGRADAPPRGAGALPDAGQTRAPPPAPRGEGVSAVTLPGSQRARCCRGHIHRSSSLGRGREGRVWPGVRGPAGQGRCCSRLLPACDGSAWRSVGPGVTCPQGLWWHVAACWVQTQDEADETGPPM